MLINMDLTNFKKLAKKSGFDGNPIRNGKMTKKYKKFQVGNVKAPIYKEIYNPNTKRWVNINSVIDKRFKKQIKVKKKFSNVVKMSENTLTFVDKQVKQNTITDTTSEKGIDTLKNVLNRVQLNGKYRIIIYQSGKVLFDDTFTIKPSYNVWWNEHINKFRANSEHFFWNLYEPPVSFIFTKLTKLNKGYIAQQAFLDGMSHCFFTPILEWAEECKGNVKSKSSVKNWDTKINIIKGSTTKTGKVKHEGYMNIFKDGIPESEIQTICDKLMIDVIIEQPFKNEPYKIVKCFKKPLKRFRFFNSRHNHVAYQKDSKFDDYAKGFKDDNKKSYFSGIYRNDLLDAEEMDFDSLQELFRTMIEKNDDFIYNKNAYGITSIKTLNKVYCLANDYNKVVSDWEKEQGFTNAFKIDALKYPQLNNFIVNGTHWNGTVDFKDVGKYKLSDLDHIDITKAYTQFKSCKWYNGFMGKITDFRKCNKIMGKGMYYIKDLDLSQCDKKFKKLNDMMGWFYTENIYCDFELKMLSDYGGKYNITCGCYGIAFDFDFSDKMKESKQTITVIGGEEIKVPYYSKWTGEIASINYSKKVYLNGDIDYLKHIANNSNGDVEISDYDNEACIRYKKNSVKHMRHISCQITAYQRIVMLQQLMKMNLDKLVRVCVDGVYFEPHAFNVDEVFSYKEKKTLNNGASDKYLSHISYFDVYDDNMFPKAGSRENYMKELFLGGGGCGKTHCNLVDTGFINPIFIAPSWKLASNKKKEYDCNVSVVQRINHGNYLRLKDDYCVYIFDEASMIPESMKHWIFDNVNAKLIFCGDIGYQLPPVKGDEMNKKGFENIVIKKTNYRSGGCKKLMELIKYLRTNIHEDNNKVLKEVLKIGISKIDNYDAKDLIICSEHQYCDEFNKKYENIEKYKVLSNSRDYCNGEIVYDKVNGIAMEKRHGYTIHSIQGETAEKILYIDTRKLKSVRMLYTAVSRARRIEQIRFI